MKIKDLKPHDKNPRKISKEELERLKASIEKYGDLSCIIYNVRTLRLAGGNQRSKIIPPDAEIKYTNRLSKPNEQGTVAEGFVIVKGENLKYREVDWSVSFETEAMIAANKLGGTWDESILRGHLFDLYDSGFDISNIGFGDFKFDFSNDNDSNNFVNQMDSQSDEEYVKETVKTFEEIPTERKDANVKYSKEKLDDLMKPLEIKQKMFILMIDCPSEEVKISLKQKLEHIVLENGAKIT